MLDPVVGPVNANILMKSQPTKETHIVERMIYYCMLEITYIMQCCFSVTKACLALCDPMDCSIPGLPVPHHLSEFGQVHVH